MDFRITIEVALESFEIYCSEHILVIFFVGCFFVEHRKSHEFFHAFLLAAERFYYVKEAFEKPNYGEGLVVSEYLAFCPDCFKLKRKKVKLSDMAIKLCLTYDAIENGYKKQ